MALDQQPISDPVFEAFNVELLPDFGEAEAREVAWRALGAALEAVNRTPEGWRIEPIHESRPGAFDLVPPGEGLPEEGALSVAEAWEVAYALHRQPGVADAEPSFVISQDNTEGLVGEEPPPEEPEVEAAAAVALAAVAEACAAPASLPESEFDWSPRLIMAPTAWGLPPGGPQGQQRGKGIRVGHPDSGFIRHPELFDPSTGEPNRVLAAQGFDFVDDDPTAEDADGQHGLGTASVIMSTDRNVPGGFVTGVAPAAEIVPIRVAKKRFLIPVPVLLGSGMTRLRKGIYHAVDNAGCHVISISLGWLRNKEVHNAVKHAVRDKNVIVVAAAGNSVGFVVWPAAYPEVIAMAGCTSTRKKWSGSSHGREVAATAPARNVWKAADGTSRVEQSDGTSFAAASTAGIAALWLAHWGRGHLLATYGAEFDLATIFRFVLRKACDPPPPGHDGEFGAGIVNACRTLSTPLPTLEELRASTSAPLLAIIAESAPSPVVISGFEAVAKAFPNVPRPVLRSRLAALFGVPESELETRLKGVGEEVAFQIATTPALRDKMLGGAGLAALEAAPGGPPELDRFSARLRARME